jgi:hypothetical protein
MPYTPNGRVYEKGPEGERTRTGSTLSRYSGSGEWRSSATGDQTNVALAIGMGESQMS